MEEVYEACLEVMRKRAADAVVIDSLPALVPSWEDEKTMSEMTVGKGAPAHQQVHAEDATPPRVAASSSSTAPLLVPRGQPVA